MRHYTTKNQAQSFEFDGSHRTAHLCTAKTTERHRYNRTPGLATADFSSRSVNIWYLARIAGNKGVPHQTGLRIDQKFTL